MSGSGLPPVSLHRHGQIITVAGQLGENFAIEPAGDGEFEIKVPGRDMVWTADPVVATAPAKSDVYLKPQDGSKETRWKFVKLEEDLKVYQSRSLLPLHLLYRCVLFHSGTPNTRTPLSDILSSSRLNTREPAIIRRAFVVSNLPPGTSTQQLLDVVHTGPLEYAKIHEDGTSATLSFLYAHSAAHFSSLADQLVIADHRPQLQCTWLPSRPLHIVVAAAREDGWTEEGLRAYLSLHGEVEVEKITLQEVADGAYRQVASVHFANIESAIRAHARLRADPFMLSVRVAYGRDRCERAPDTSSTLGIPTCTSPPARTHSYTYFPVIDSDKGKSQDIIAQPYTTVSLYNLHPATTMHDMCKRIFGGPLYNVKLRAADSVSDSRTAKVTFLHSEDARDFYVGATMRGFTLLGRRVRLEPYVESRPPSRPPSRSSLPLQATDYDWVLPPQDRAPPLHAAPPEYTRILTLHAFDAPTTRLTRLRKQVARDFGRFGELEGVWVDRTTPHHSTFHIAFAHAPHAVRARARIAIVRPEYGAYALGFGRDLCARGVPAGDEWAADRWVPHNDEWAGTSRGREGTGEEGTEGRWRRKRKRRAENRRRRMAEMAWISRRHQSKGAGRA
ncbi:hypothetical protein C8R45DRAFT_1211225 [Mycena sanguinolenta]|nr:hypothetical protein C8R45DRAFT_1211225 [Mycena sanguinolenta]